MEGKFHRSLQGRVIALEPIPEIFAALSRNIDAYRKQTGSLDGESRIDCWPCSHDIKMPCSPPQLLHHSETKLFGQDVILNGSYPASGSVGAPIELINEGVSNGVQTAAEFTFYPRAAGSNLSPA